MKPEALRDKSNLRRMPTSVLIGMLDDNTLRSMLETAGVLQRPASSDIVALVDYVTSITPIVDDYSQAVMREIDRRLPVPP